MTASVGPPPRIRRYRSAGTRGQDGAEIRGSERDITHTGPQPHILYPPPRLPPLLPHSSAPSSSAPPLLLLLAAASLSSAAAGEGLNPFRHRLRHRSSIRASFRVAAGPVGASQRGSQWRPRPAVARAGAAKATRGRRKRKVLHMSCYLCPTNKPLFMRWSPSTTKLPRLLLQKTSSCIISQSVLGCMNDSSFPLRLCMRDKRGETRIDCVYY